MHTKRGEYHILIDVKDGNFDQVDVRTFSGKNAVVDAIFYLDEKYSPSAIEIIRRML